MARNQKGAKGEERSARRGGLRAVAADLPKVTRKALGRRGLGAGGLIADWPDIVGAELAAVCLPYRLSRRGEGTLTLRVEPGHGVTLQHLEPLLIERINGYLGHRAVVRLSLRQAPLGRGRAAPRTAPRALSAAEEADLQARTAVVGDTALRGALERLGRAVRQSATEADTP